MVGQVALTAGVVPALVAGSGPAAAMAPSPIFAPYVNYDVGRAHSAAVGDFTGGGRNDALVSLVDSASLLAQTSDGRLTEVERLPLSGTLDWFSEGGVAAADLDGDGRTDAAVASGPSFDVFVQRNGTLTAAPPLALAGVHDGRRSTTHRWASPTSTTTDGPTWSRPVVGRPQ